MIRSMKSRKFMGMAIAATTVAVGVWTLRKILTSAEGALASEEPEGGKTRKAMEAVKGAASEMAGKTGAVAGRIKSEKSEEKAGEAMEQMQEMKETAGEAAEEMKGEAAETAGQMAQQAGETMGAARESAITAAPGMMSWMRRNSRLVLGIGLGSFALIGMMMWRRGKKADLGEAGESIVDRIGGIAQEAADMLKDTTGDIRNSALDELENRIEKLRAA